MADAEGLPDVGARLRRRRAAAQLLQPRRRRSPVEIVRHVLAVQAQDFRAAPLALRARGSGFRRTDVHAALDRAEIVIGWLNRGTLHMVCREDYAWLLALTAPTQQTANRRRLAQEGVSEAATERAVKAIVEALDDGPMLRRDLKDAVRRARVPAEGQAMVHLLFAASLAGLIVRGPVRGKEQTFALVRDHLCALPDVDRGAALRELGIRYAAAHAPAAPEDLVWWSGLPLRDVRPAITAAGDGSDRIPAHGRGPREIPPRLIPAWDAYILGWKQRTFAIPAEHTQAVFPGGGMFQPAALVDGRVEGIWRLRKGRVEIDAAPEVVQALEAEAEDVAAFG